MKAEVRIRWLVAALLALLGAAGALIFGWQSGPDEPSRLQSLPEEVRVFSGDFDGMLANRAVRALVPHSRTLYYTDNGHERGITAETVRDFERYLNKKYKSRLGRRPITVYLLPTRRDALLDDLVNGLGDFAAGNLTVTAAREDKVRFVAPTASLPNREIVLSAPGAPAVATAEALSGRVVHVRQSSSYHESLVALNQRLATDGKRAVSLVTVPDELEDEDMMEMLGLGQFQHIVVDAWKARMWAPRLPAIRLDEGAVLREAGRVGWALRKSSPLLARELEAFYAEQLQATAAFEVRRLQSAARIGQLRNPMAEGGAKRFADMLALFDKYGSKYGFDPLMLAAQGFQESQLNPAARSRMGAVGVMQILPSTGSALRVGDIAGTEANIHAGAKYLDQLIRLHFKDADFDTENRTLFAIAAYNAGPQRIRQMRQEAARRGLDPDKWFNHVELVTAERVGLETTTYVRNVLKYYTSYKLTLEAQQELALARTRVLKP